MKNIADVIVEVCKSSHVPMAGDIFGNRGIRAIFNVMKAVQALYCHVEPERIEGTVIIYQLATDAQSSREGDSRPISFEELANKEIRDLRIEISEGGEFNLITGDHRRIETIAETAVVYYFESANEGFFAGGDRRLVEKFDPSARSQFSVPTFADLRAALRSYEHENVRESTCYIFRKTWFDENRRYFLAAPESIMRNSLTQFLRNRMASEYDVLPEQNVNEKNPVDIRIQPRFKSSRLMLIEIKWMGDSVAANGRITASHRDARAKEGAIQLIDYMEEQLRTTPTRVVQGFYVVIDGRRRGLSDPATADGTILRADGMHYEEVSIAFEGAHKRPNLDVPYRMFTRPVCSD